MNSEFERQFDALIDKYSELLTGDSSKTVTDKVRIWAIYQHIHKSMPALVNHWSKSHPEARADMRSIFEDIRELNQTLKASATTEAEPDR